LDYSWEDELHHLWFTESGTGHVGLLVISASGNLVATRRLPLSSPSSMPVGITVDSSEQVWVAEYDGKMIATWRPPYSYNTFLPILFN